MKLQETAQSCNGNARKDPVNGSFIAENRQKLPDFARVLVDAIGFDDALFVIDRLGGASWRIPANNKPCREREAMTERIGEARFERLQKHFAGETLYIPKCQKALLAARNQAIREALASHSIRELVTRFQLSDRRIAQIARQQPPLQMQVDLFAA